MDENSSAEDPLNVDYTRLERPKREKHSSSLKKLIN